MIKQQTKASKYQRIKTSRETRNSKKQDGVMVKKNKGVSKRDLKEVVGL